jgi:hypothetical protein
LPKIFRVKLPSPQQPARRGGCPEVHRRGGAGGPRPASRSRPSWCRRSSPAQRRADTPRGADARRRRRRRTRSPEEPRGQLDHACSPHLVVRHHMAEARPELSPVPLVEQVARLACTHEIDDARRRREETPVEPDSPARMTASRFFGSRISTRGTGTRSFFAQSTTRSGRRILARRRYQWRSAARE